VTPPPASGSRGGTAEREPEVKPDLGVTRTVLAAERTLMAWVRTALSMISFGFTIYKFLEAFHQSGVIHLRRPDTPRNLGLFLVTLGIGSLLAGMFEHVRIIRALPGPRSRLGAVFYVACTVLILGITVLGGLIRHVGPF
jgi:putative membrane protein